MEEPVCKSATPAWACVWCPQGWTWAETFPRGSEMGFPSPQVASCLLRWEGGILALCHCNATQLWSSHVRAKWTILACYCTRKVLLTGLVLVAPLCWDQSRAGCTPVCSAGTSGQEAGSSWATDWVKNKFLADQPGYHRLYNFTEAIYWVKNS